MNNFLKYTARTVALLLTGSATLLLSCKSKTPPAPNPETLMTQRSDTLTMIVSKNGKKQYRFDTPLMERYELAREPYMEFREGIYLETFKDSTEQIESTILSDYAIRYETRSLWEARGNVIATGEDGRTLYTEQLFWDEKTERIYSNVDSKVVQGDDIFIGEGFESDERFRNWTFRNYIGRLAVDVSQDEKPDSTSASGSLPGKDNPPPAAAPRPSSTPDTIPPVRPVDQPYTTPLRESPSPEAPPTPAERPGRTHERLKIGAQPKGSTRGNNQ